MATTSTSTRLCQSALRLRTIQSLLWKRIRLFSRLPRRGAHRPKGHKNVCECLTKTFQSDEFPLCPHYWTSSSAAFIVSALPDIFRHRILDILPFYGLQTMVTFDRVILSRFANMKESAYIRRNRLTLRVGKCPDPDCNCVPREEYVGEKNGACTKVGVLHLEDSSNQLISESYLELTPDVTSQLIATYCRKLTNLEIVCNEVNIATIDPHLISLLDRWGSQLTRLQLWFDHVITKDTSAVSKAFRRLFACLTPEKMPQLKRLTFHYQGDICDETHSNVDLPILEQLEEFTFQGGYGEQLLDSLKRNAVANKQLQRIALGSRIDGFDDMDAFLKIPATIAPKFTYIEVHQSDADCHKLQSLLKHFKWLNTLSLNLSRISAYQLYRILEPLTSLSYLRLSLDLRKLESLEVFPKDYPQLPSVKVLELTFTGCQSRDSLSPLKLHQIFPNVQLLRFVLNGQRRRGSTEAELVTPFVKHCNQLKLVCASLNNGKEKVWQSSTTSHF